MRELLANTKEFASEHWDAVVSGLKEGRLPSEVRRALHVRFLLNMEKPLVVASAAATGAGDIIVAPPATATATSSSSSSEEIAAIIAGLPEAHRFDAWAIVPTVKTPGQELGALMKWTGLVDEGKLAPDNTTMEGMLRPAGTCSESILAQLPPFAPEQEQEETQTPGADSSAVEEATPRRMLLGVIQGTLLDPPPPRQHRRRLRPGGPRRHRCRGVRGQLGHYRHDGRGQERPRRPRLRPCRRGGDGWRLRGAELPRYQGRVRRHRRGRRQRRPPPRRGLRQARGRVDREGRKPHAPGDQGAVRPLLCLHGGTLRHPRPLPVPVGVHRHPPRGAGRWGWWCGGRRAVGWGVVGGEGGSCLTLGWHARFF